MVRLHFSKSIKNRIFNGNCQLIPTFYPETKVGVDRRQVLTLNTAADSPSPLAKTNGLLILEQLLIEFGLRVKATLLVAGG